MFCKCMTRKEEYQERRKNLCVLSAEAREQRTALVRKAKTEKEALYWGAQPLNRFIVEKYLQRFSGGEFLTFHQWKEKGRTIKKGEKGFPIWAQPLGSREGDGEDEDGTYFPMCYLFHESQTVDRE